MDLAVDERGLLLVGVHDVTMEVVKERFGRFQKSDRRPMLFARLSAFVDAVKKAECGHSIIIDGSFVMACVDEPDDIDLILVLPIDWDETADLRPYQYNLVSKRVVKKSYGFDVFVVTRGSESETQWTSWFGGVNVKWRDKFGWPDDARKGLARVLL